MCISVIIILDSIVLLSSVTWPVTRILQIVFFSAYNAMLQFSHFDLLFLNNVPIMLEIFIIILTKKWIIQNTRHKYKSSYTDVSTESSILLDYLSPKLFDKSENSRSAAAENCRMTNTILQAPDQCGRSIPCFFHQPSLSTLLETPSEPATYMGSSYILLIMPRIIIKCLCLPIMLKIMPA